MHNLIKNYTHIFLLELSILNIQKKSGENFQKQHFSISYPNISYIDTTRTTQTILRELFKSMKFLIY